MKGSIIVSCVAAAATLTSMLVPLPVAGQPDSAPWWDPPTVTGPEDFRNGWNLRVPIRIHNERDYALRAGEPAIVHLDMAQLAVEAGWPSVASGDLRIPRGFTFDPDSVRLVQYESLWSAVRAEVPSRTHLDWFEPDQSARFDRIQTEPFEATTAAFVTLLWRLPTDLPPGKAQYYFVYYEVLENSDKPAKVYDDDAEERLDGVFWSGRGTVFYGFEPGQGGPNLEVAGIEPHTRVSVFVYPPGLPLPRLDTRPGVLNPFTVEPGTIVRYPRELGPNPVAYKVVADRPVLVSTYSSASVGGTFIPSLDGDAVGSSFLFVARSPGIFVTAPIRDDPLPADVRIRIAGTPGVPAPERVFPGETHAVTDLQVGSAYVIESSRPVIAQSAPVPVQPGSASIAMGQVQVPSNLGSPLGRQFFASIRTQGSPPSGIEATAWDARARLQALDPPADPRNPAYPKTGGTETVERGIVSSRFIPAQSLFAMQQFGALPNPPQITDTHIIRNPSCEEWSCAPGQESFTGLLSIRAGQANARSTSTNPNPTQNLFASPYGGREALEFAFFGGYVAFAHFNTTVIETEQLDAGLGSPGSVVLDRDMYTTFDAPVKAPISVRANKPITVLPWPISSAAEYVLYPPPSLLPLSVEIGRGEFRGFLAGLTSPFGDDPLFVTSRPGDTLRIPLEVTNLGRWSDGVVLRDTIGLSVRAAAADWPGRARIHPNEIQLDSGESASAELSVELPPDHTGIVSLSVEAVSRGNPSIRTDLQILVFAQRSFGVRLWFGDASSTAGPRTMEVRVSPQGERLIDLVLQNAGSSVDSFRISATPPGGQWSAQLLRGGNPVSVVADVPPQGRVPLTLRLRSPATEEVAAVAVQIDALSQTSESAADRIVLLARLSLGTSLRLDVTPPALSLDPGGLVGTTATLTNDGKEPVRARIRVTPRVPDGWAAKLVGDVDSPSASEITLFPRQSAAFRIEMGAPRAALYRSSGSVLVVAEAGEDAFRLADAATVLATVNQVFDIAITPATAEPQLPGATLNLTLQVQNRGNGEVSVEPVPAFLPRGWTLAVPNTTVRPDGTATLRMRLTIAPDAPAGIETIQIRLEGVGDKNRTAEFRVPVKRVYDVRVTPPANALVLPGESREDKIIVENHGNGPETIRIEVSALAGWSFRADPTQLSVAAQGSAVARVSTVVSDVALDGPIAPQVRFTSLESGDVDVARLELDVARPALRVESTRIVGAATGHEGDVVFVASRIRNDGRLPAETVPVVLLRDGAPVDSAVLGRIPPRTDVLVTLRAGITGPSVLSVVVDPNRTIPDTDYSDNSVLVDQPTRILSLPETVPGGAGWISLAVVSMLAGWRRRRT